jgi:hypothetical protein
MGKQQLKAYLHNLDKEEIIDQVITLYTTSKEVKKYYDFLLKPDLEKVADEWKVKISKEYFPAHGKRRKARRSVGQRATRELEFLGVTADVIADVRLYAIEIAVLYAIEMHRHDVAFFKSFEQQYSKLIDYLRENGMLSDFKVRCGELKDKVVSAGWTNARKFEEKYVTTYMNKQS